MAEILIVEDHTVFRQAIAHYLSSRHKNYTVFEASNGQEGLDLLARDHVDLILLDIEMPVLNGLEMLTMLREMKIATPVIILTVVNEFEFASRLLEKEVRGYLLKNCELDELDEAIEVVLAGKTYYSSFVMNLVHKGFTEYHYQPVVRLSPREWEICKLISMGMSNKKMAEFLNLELSTVESYRKSLLKKTQMKNVAQLVSFANRFLSSSHANAEE